VVISGGRHNRFDPTRIWSDAQAAVIKKSLLPARARDPDPLPHLRCSSAPVARAARIGTPRVAVSPRSFALGPSSPSS
jgi:hypothetical protein